jgi:uroporphyrinogen decarboxylase
MTATSRELVYQTLNFQNPARAPRDLWVLPLAQWTYPSEYAAILRDFPNDMASPDGHEREQPRTIGDPYKLGEYTDEWGCTFHSIQAGVIGEVKDALIKNWDEDIKKVHIPREWLTIDPDAVNRQCIASDKFMLGGPCPRPFEQLQFLRGSVDLYMDLMDPPKAMLSFVRQMHQFYTELLIAWAKTDVDGLRFMDDWGSQRILLIKPALWREFFKPMYAEYAQIAHSYGKKLFMHSDGHILAIYPDLIEIGVDAVNSQIFCMGTENLRPFAGKITFWGEVDRQHLLVDASPQQIDQAVRDVYAKLWANGGCFAQCEFGAGAKPANVRQVYESWDLVSQGK